MSAACQIAPTSCRSPVTRRSTCVNSGFSGLRSPSDDLECPPFLDITILDDDEETRILSPSGTARPFPAGPNHYQNARSAETSGSSISAPFRTPALSPSAIATPSSRELFSARHPFSNSPSGAESVGLSSLPSTCGSHSSLAAVWTPSPQSLSRRAGFSADAPPFIPWGDSPCPVSRVSPSCGSTYSPDLQSPSCDLQSSPGGDRLSRSYGSPHYDESLYAPSREQRSPMAAGSYPLYSHGPVVPPRAAPGGTDFSQQQHDGVVTADKGSASVVDIAFKRGTHLQYLCPSGVSWPPGSFVVVDGDRGLAVGRVVNQYVIACDAVIFDKDELRGRRPSRRSAGVKVVGSVQRLATVTEIASLEALREAEAEAVVLARRAVEESALDMAIIDAEYQFDKRKLTLYYVARERLDFKDLVRALYRLFHTRIWLTRVEGDEEECPN